MIVCDGLVKIYETDHRKVMALEGLDLVINDSEFMAIIGKSGSGKSTLLNMIGGLENPTAGTLTVDGRDISTLKENEMVKYRRDTVGFVWQKSSKNLFPYLTVLDNVKVPMQLKNEKNRKAEQLLEAVGMLKHKNKFPNQLSGGEQQRVAIAVALANSPSILLADEPTGAVDSKTAEQIFKLFSNLNRKLGITIIIVTHDISLADKVDRTVLISDGKISSEKLKEEPSTEYTVLDKAHRIKLTDEMLEAAGINSDKVIVKIEDGKLVITKEENDKG